MSPPAAWWQQHKQQRISERIKERCWDPDVGVLVNHHHPSTVRTCPGAGQVLNCYNPPGGTEVLSSPLEAWSSSPSQLHRQSGAGAARENRRDPIHVLPHMTCGLQVR